MRFSVDTQAQTLAISDADGDRTVPLYGEEAFDALSRVWLQVGWELRYTYNFSWMGRPLIQLPEDLVRVQEVVHRVRPDVLVETGVAHGGGLVFYASLFKVLGRGRVIGVERELRAENRAAIEAHPLRSLISLVDGDSADSTTVARVRDLIRPGDAVLVVLDSNHTKAHVLAELAAYAPLVTEGSYLIAADGIMAELSEVPSGRREWLHDNPREAAAEFAARHSEFVLEEPPMPFHSGKTLRRMTYWGGGFLRRRTPSERA
jgi:cephalosporin hydroxylase